MQWAAKIAEQGAAETLNYCDYPSQHWRSLRTNNPLERIIIGEIRRRKRVAGAIPDGKSTLMIITAKLDTMPATSGAQDDIRTWKESKN